SSQLAEVDIFFGADWIVTVRGHNEQGEEWPLTEPRARFERTCPHQPTSGFLVYTLLDSLVDGYFDATDRAEDVLEALEDDIFSEAVANERDVQRHLFDIRRR